MTTSLKQGQYPAEAYFSAKCDASFAHFLWDYPTDKNLTYNAKSGYGDELELLVDPNHDKTSTLKTDEFVIKITWLASKQMTISLHNWSGTDWSRSYPEGIKGSSALSTSAHSDIPHAIYELAVPRPYFHRSSMRNWRFAQLPTQTLTFFEHGLGRRIRKLYLG